LHQKAATLIHHTRPAVAGVAALASSALLVTASAGFGCVFAWTQGAQHGPLMGALSVAMAAGLELAKPLAVAGAFAAAREWQPGKALALASLATLAILFSLTAELGGIAGARGDLVAERAAHVAAAKDATTRRERIEGELATLGTVRPAATIQAEIAGLLADRRLGDCTQINGPRTRATCPMVASLRAELGRAERRESLEQALATVTGPMPNAPAVQAADPGAAALSAYLGALGFAATPAGIGEWLVLIPVLALEIGSALAAALARSGLVVPAAAPGSVHAMRPYADLRQPEPDTDTAARSERASVDTQSPAITATTASRQEAPKGSRGQVHGRRVGQPTALGRGATEARIVDTLRTQGGRVDATVRSLATTIGAKRSTVHNALAGLLAAGAVARVGGELVLRG
jgi:hypothetical protein